MEPSLSPIDTGPLISKVAEAGALAAFELIVILGLAFLVWHLLKKHGEMHQSTLDAYIKNTEIVSEFKEMIRNLVGRN